MKPEVENNLSRLLKRLGYGDVDSARLLFVGIEEGGAPIDSLGAQMPDHPSPVAPWDWAPENRPRWSPVWTIISKVASRLYGSGDLDSYRKQKQNLFRNGNYAVLVELFPLARRTIKEWPYHSLTSKQYEDWLSRNLHERFALIRAVQDGMRNRVATVCFGVCKWKVFMDCFRLSSTQCEEHGIFRVYPTQKTVLAPFFGFGRGTMSNDRINLLVGLLGRFESGGHAK